MRKLKNRLYYFFVEKNFMVREEYQYYVNEHQEEHKDARWKHWLLLLKLNWQYRILKKGKRKALETKKSQRLPYLDGAESSVYKRPLEIHFAKELLQYDVISFDIFDTLLLRPFAKPSDLFMVIGHKLKCVDFMQIRINAEKQARAACVQKHGNHEITILDIYEIIERRTGIDKMLGVQTEVDTEVEFCFANPYMKRVYKILQEHGKRIILTSDMYLPTEYMVQLLNKCGYTSYEKLYVSCEYFTNKRSGGLFRNIIHQMGSNTRIVHVGDNYTSDFKSAKEQGLETRYYKNVHDIGKAYRADGMSELVGSLYAGIVNTHLHNGTKRYSPYYEYGFIYGGLYIVGYCNWIYQKAKREGVDKVLFLSRDGDIYQKVFNMMFDDMPNECFYYSRIANLKYAAKYTKEDYITRVVKHKAYSAIPLTLSCVFESANLTFLVPELSKCKLHPDMILTPDLILPLEDFICEHWEKILLSYEAEKQVFKSYLGQMLGEAKKVAFVDVGWIGSGARGIQNIVRNEMNAKWEILNWVAASRNSSHTAILSELQTGRINAYIFSRMQNRNLYDTHVGTNKGTNCIYFELFTQACFPSFAGTTLDGGYKFDIPEVENYQMVSEIHAGILDFAEKYYAISKAVPFILNISGFDAYVPFRTIIKNLTFIKKYFGRFCYARGISGDKNAAKLETLNDIFISTNMM